MFMDLYEKLSCIKTESCVSIGVPVYGDIAKAHAWL